MAKRVAEVVGLDRAQATMAKAARDLGDLSAAHARAGEIVAARGRSNAPRRSGRLAGSVGARGTKDAMEAYATAPYAGVIEYGWPGHRIHPQPYLRPAIEDTEAQTVRTYEAELDGVVASIKGA